MRHGEEVKISKRAGSYVTLRDLIDWCGKDAVRFFLLSRKASTEFVFDVDLAVKQTDENPVYYVQYAHARICSALLQEYEAYHQKSDINQAETIKAVEHGLFEAFPQILNADLSVLIHESELSLCKKLAQYPDVLKQATAHLSPHDVVYYVRELAKELHSYYNQCKWRCEDEHLKMARFALIIAVRQILRNAAGIIGIDMPAKM
jgi:arginyl-tRNA synthetase